MLKETLELPSSTPEAINKLKGVLFTIVEYKSQAVGILPKKILDRLPSQDIIPTIIEKIAAEDTPNAILTAWLKTLISIQRDIRNRCIQHLQGLKRLRDDFVDPLAATYPWFTKTTQSIEDFKAFDINEVSPDTAKGFISLIDAYIQCVTQANKEELTKIAEKNGQALYSARLHFLETIVVRYGDLLSSKQFLLDDIAKIKTLKTTQPDALFETVKQIDYITWTIQKKLVSRWRQLFNTPEIEASYKLLINSTVLPENEFLKLADRHIKDDKTAIIYTTEQLKKNHRQLEYDFEKLREMHCFATESGVINSSFNTTFQTLMASQLDLGEKVKKITPSTSLKALRTHVGEVEHLKKQVAPLRKALINLCIRTWHRDSLKVCPLEQTPSLFEELKPIKSALSLEDALEAVKAHALHSETFQTAKTFFPEEMSALEKTLGQEVSDKGVLIDTLEQYYRYMRLAAFTQSHLDDYPAFTAVVNEKTSFYRSMNVKTLHVIQKSYTELNQRYSKPLKAPHLFHSSQDRFKIQLREETAVGANASPVLKTEAELRKLLIAYHAQVTQQQAEIQDYLKLLQDPHLNNLVGKETVEQVRQGAEQSLYTLLNIHERLTQIELMLEPKEIEKASFHAANAMKYLSRIDNRWPQLKKTLFQTLQNAYADVTSRFHVLAEKVDQYSSEMAHYDHPEEKENLRYLYQRQSIVNQLRNRLTQASQKEMSLLERCKMLIELHKETDRVIIRISRTKSGAPSEHYIPFNRSKHEKALLALRESAQTVYIDTLLRQSVSVKQRLDEFHQAYFPYLSTQFKQHFSEQTKSIENFASQARIASLFSSSVNRSLSRLKEDYEKHSNLLSKIDETITHGIERIHYQHNQSIHSATQTLKDLPDLSIPAYNNHGELFQATLWQSDGLVYQLQNARLIKDSKMHVMHDCKRLLMLQNETRHHTNTINLRYASLNTLPQRAEGETETDHQARKLLHLIHQALPEISAKITEILTYLPDVHQRKNDPGFNTLLNLHQQLRDAESQYFNQSTKPAQFKARVASTLQHHILNEDKLTQLSKYQNGGLLQWFRTNPVFRAIIKFFSFSNKTPVVAGASQLEKEVYEVARRCEQVLQSQGPGAIRQQRSTFFYPPPRRETIPHNPHSSYRKPSSPNMPLIKITPVASF